MGCFSVSTDTVVETSVTRIAYLQIFFSQYSIFPTSSKLLNWIFYFPLFYSTSTLSQAAFNLKLSPDSMEDVLLTSGFLILGAH